MRIYLLVASLSGRRVTTAIRLIRAGIARGETVSRIHQSFRHMPISEDSPTVGLREGQSPLVGHPQLQGAEVRLHESTGGVGFGSKEQVSYLVYQDESQQSFRINKVPMLSHDFVHVGHEYCTVVSLIKRREGQPQAARLVALVNGAGRMWISRSSLRPSSDELSCTQSELKIQLDSRTAVVSRPGEIPAPLFS